MKNEEKHLNKLLETINNTDRFFLQVSISLMVFGLIFAFTSSTHESYRLTKNFFALGFKQLTAFISGAFLLILCWWVNYKFWFKHAWNIAIPVLILMILTVFTGLGKEMGGSQRWIDIGFIQFQPAEIAKLVVLILISKQLSLYKWNEKKTYLYLGFLMLLILIILKQPDLGTALILLFLIFELLFLYEWPLWLLGSFSLVGFFGCYLKILSTPYQLDRLKFWLNPNLEPLGRGYNIIQAKYALGFGGIFGAGIGNSIQKQGNLPVPHSDFIFAVISEEFGFIGACVILILFVTWLLRGLYLTKKINDKFASVFGSSIILLIITQTLVNISVAIGLFPITGVTLPFFSCGGTSLMVTLAMCGILFNVVSEKRNL